MSATIAFYLSQQPNIFNLNTQREPEEMGRVVYQDSQGSPKYSSGSCKVDVDCYPAGCSTHYCSSDPKLITTCEFRDDFPSEEEFDCGCVEKTCVWFEKE
jgi:eight-cysteine-cluster-containing protein